MATFANSLFLWNNQKPLSIRSDLSIWEEAEKAKEVQGLPKVLVSRVQVTEGSTFYKR
jgi:hypothetical protein